MGKKTGDLNPLQQKELDTGGLLMAQKKIGSQNMSETMIESEDYALLTFLEENPEASLSNFINSLELMGNTGWWFTISPVVAKDGTVLARISLAPPETHEIKILEDESSGIKKILLNKK